ncbi:WD40-repeat-containing domain protein [Mycena epipterygia]|nr:WD40-repeat-containing domain protein [Mycena epipterygia]
MASTYSLTVQTVEGVSWRPVLFRKKPNLYVVICREDLELERTRTIKRELSPKWNHTSKSSFDESAVIRLRLLHHSSLPGVTDACIGVVDITIATLIKLGSDNADTKAPAKLELMGVTGVSKGKPVGTLCVRLMKDVEAAATALEQAQTDVAELGLGATSSAIMTTTGGVTKTVATVDSLASGLGTLIPKLKIIVDIGDEIATIHPFVNIAWKVLTSVYQAVKKQQETDDKLCSLVKTMIDVYSFVEDTGFLAEKIKSLEVKTLAIAKQTVECALFIQEYTVHGFCSRTVRNTWTDTDKRIDDLSAVLLNLKASFDGSLIVQSLFLSTKVLGKLEGLEKSDALKKLDAAKMNASSRTSCLAGTRREILDDIATWLAVPSDSGGILWLTGVAGSGKSTISTTVAESFRELHRLGAFIFFDRNDRARSHPDAVVRTLAHSIGLSNPHIGSAISTVIQGDPDIVNAPIQTQFKALLLDPLQSVEHCIQGPILIILDALDECGDPDSRRLLLSVLSDELPKLPNLFRFLITSRPDKDIVKRFRPRFAEKQLDVASSTDDITLFIRTEMARIAEEESVGPTWPGEQSIQTLVKLSGGLFIWASTATRFIAGYQPTTSLEIVMAQGSPQEFSLDKLYAVALQLSGPWGTNTRFAQDARAVLACVVLGQVPMTDRIIDALLFEQATAAGVLNHLGCVIQWTAGAYARTLHASFADYLTDPERSGGQPWSIDLGINHRTLSLACLRILNSPSELRFNMCGLKDSHLLNVAVPRLSDQVAAAISPQLLYSSCFWLNHIQATLFDTRVLEEMDMFFHNQFLYWLEVLSLLGQIPMATAALEVAGAYSKGHDEDLKDFIADTMKFVSAFAPVMAQSAPHIYLSALAFAPHASKVKAQFAAKFPQTLKFHGPLGTHWPNLQKEFRGPIAVFSVCFSYDGAGIVSGFADGTLRVWDAQTGALIVGPLEGHENIVRSVHFSPDPARIVSGSQDNTIRVWDADTGAPVLVIFKAHTDYVKCFHFSPDGTQIASASLDNGVRVEDARSNSTYGIVSVNFSHDGARIASYSKDNNTVCVWDALTGARVVGPLGNQTSKFWSGCVKFSPDGTRIVSGGGDSMVRVWDAETGALVVGPLEGHVDDVTSVDFSPDGTQIVSASRDKTLRIWDAQTGALVGGPLQGHLDEVNSVAFSRDGARIASASDDQTLRIWDAQTGDLVGGPLEGHSETVLSVHFSPDGTRIASGSVDSTVRIWDVHPSSLVVRSSNQPNRAIQCIHFSPDGVRIAGGTSEGKVLIWDVQTGALLVGPLEGHTSYVNSVRFSPDGKWIASGSIDETVRVWDAQTGALFLGPWEGHKPGVTSVDFSPDGMRIAAASYSGDVRVWDVQTAVIVAGPFKVGSTALYSIHFSPDGTRIVSGDSSRTVSVWDVHTGVLVAGPFEGHTNRVTSVNFSPDGAWIASGSADCTVRIWDAHSGDLVASLEGHTESITSVHFSPDGAWIASGSRDCTVRIWDTHTGDLVASLEGHTSGITSVYFSPDGARIASSSWNGTARVWDIRPGVVAGSWYGDTGGDSSDSARIASDDTECTSQINSLRNLPTFDLTTGWVLKAGAPMFWVPPWLREGLYFPGSTVVIRDRGTTKLDLSQFVHGLEWQNCIAEEFKERK